MVGENKRVVFIGSCSYSGSTVLDLMIGASEDSVSLGELGRAYYPLHPHHMRKECGCLDPECEYWDGISDSAQRDVHQRVFSKHGGDVLVDSTKDPHWIKDRSEELSRAGIDVLNILVWKTPQEIEASFRKRGMGKKWRKHWVNYHRLYFSLVEEFVVIPFSSIISSNRELEKRLEKVKIEVNRNYWEKPTCSLFGNDSAKRHLYKSKSDNYRILKDRRGKELVGMEVYQHRTVGDLTDLNIDDAEYPIMVEKIRRFLERNDVNLRDGKITGELESELRMGKIQAWLRRPYRKVRTISAIFGSGS